MNPALFDFAPAARAAVRLFVVLAGLALAACADGAAVDSSGASSSRSYSLSYSLSYKATLQPTEGIADVEIQVAQDRDLLRILDFNAPPSRFTGFQSDGEIEVDGDRVLWKVPATGGRFRYQVTVDHLRGNVHDARMTDSWAVFRLDDIFPAARTRALKGSQAEATLTFSGPDGWRFETPYGPSNKRVHTLERARLFPRPVGWTVAGIIGVRRDWIAERRVAVAAPVNEGFRRQDVLAFLRWTLPALVEVFPDFSERLLIVGGGRDMWRGGLSAPASLYMHPDRPLISGNGTSTLIHELVHVAAAATEGERDDWLVEGIAEYYSLELLRRTGGISQRRFDGAFEALEDWAARDGGHLANPSTGADTAFATLLLHELAGNLEEKGQSLDILVQDLLKQGLNSTALSAGLARLGVEAELPLPGPNASGVAQ